MGIVNVTTDSFSLDGCLSKEHGHARAIRQAKRMVRQGADIIDIGGESTRPGAAPVSTDEELRRVIPVISKLAKTVSVPISIDTYKPLVARHALDAGATIVNNIMGVKVEKTLLTMVRRYNAAIVLMHIQGTPRTMQKNIHYSDLIADIIAALKHSRGKCLETGIKSDRIILDPGICFGKTVEHNLSIINRLNEFSALNQPMLVGPSRKSFIGKVLDKEVSFRLIGTIASVCASVMRGAHIVRVHDVDEVKQAVTLTDAIINAQAS